MSNRFIYTTIAVLALILVGAGIIYSLSFENVEERESNMAQIINAISSDNN